MLAWNPQVIVTWDDRFYRVVKTNPTWAGIDAVRGGHVALSPGLPFGWIDRPPSLNRLIGLRWLADVLYPDRTGWDLRAETRAFYRLFYQVELDDAKLDRLIGEALSSLDARRA